MKRHALALSILAAVAMTGAGCSGCAPLSAIVSPAPLAGKTLIDEKALGVAYSAATGANILITHLAPLATREQALQLKKLKADYDLAISGAEKAKAVGDAAGYGAKIVAAQRAFDQFNIIAATVKAH